MTVVAVTAGLLVEVGATSVGAQADVRGSYTFECVAGFKGLGVMKGLGVLAAKATHANKRVKRNRCDGEGTETLAPNGVLECPSTSAAASSKAKVVSFVGFTSLVSVEDYRDAFGRNAVRAEELPGESVHATTCVENRKRVVLARTCITDTGQCAAHAETPVQPAPKTRTRAKFDAKCTGPNTVLIDTVAEGYEVLPGTDPAACIKITRPPRQNRSSRATNATANPTATARVFQDDDDDSGGGAWFIWALVLGGAAAGLIIAATTNNNMINLGGGTTVICPLRSGHRRARGNVPGRGSGSRPYTHEGGCPFNHSGLPTPTTFVVPTTTTPKKTSTPNAPSAPTSTTTHPTTTTTDPYCYEDPDLGYVCY